MDKYGRNYILSVEAQDGTTVTIRPPFTMEFDVVRKSLSSASVSTIRVYNLSPEVRKSLLKNQFDYGDQRLITLRAGYGAGPNFPTCFTGTVSKAFSVREGTNFVTQFESFDGGFAFVNANISEGQGVFPAGTPIRTIIQSFIDSLSPYGVKAGAVGDFPGTIPRKNSYSGNTIEVLKELTQGSFYIDGGKAFALTNNETLNSAEVAPVINSASGLLGTPVRQETLLLFTTLFEPSLFIGQQIKLESKTADNFNTFYKVTALHHQGIISDSICGDATTEIEVFYGVNATHVSEFDVAPGA